MGSNGLHNAVAVRNASFARFIPKLVMKFLRIPAMFGGAAIAGLAYIQYQAARMLTNILSRCLLIMYRSRKLCA